MEKGMENGKDTRVILGLLGDYSLLPELTPPLLFEYVG